MEQLFLHLILAKRPRSDGTTIFKIAILKHFTYLFYKYYTQQILISKTWYMIWQERGFTIHNSLIHCFIYTFILCSRGTGTQARQSSKHIFYYICSEATHTIKKKHNYKRHLEGERFRQGVQGERNRRKAKRENRRLGLHMSHHLSSVIWGDKLTHSACAFH